MDSGERAVTVVPGALDLDGFFTIMAERMIEHAIKQRIIGNERNITPVPKEGENT